MEGIDIERILGQDLSIGTESFRESLLERCLSVLGQEAQDGMELEDDEIEMLAAAGIVQQDPDDIFKF